MGAFAAPNQATVMTSLPARYEGACGGMNATFQNSTQVLFIGVFFFLMIAELSTTLSTTLKRSLMPHGVAATVANHVASLPPVPVSFAAFLGYNPIRALLGPDALALLSAADRAALTGQSLFPELIETPFSAGLRLIQALPAGQEQICTSPWQDLAIRGSAGVLTYGGGCGHTRATRVFPRGSGPIEWRVSI
jgi:hypothetical protein